MKYLLFFIFGTSVGGLITAMVAEQKVHELSQQYTTKINELQNKYQPLIDLQNATQQTQNATQQKQNRDIGECVALVKNQQGTIDRANVGIASAIHSLEKCMIIVKQDHPELQ